MMSAKASQITGVSNVCSTFCSGADKRKRQNSASLAFVIPLSTWKIFPFDDVISFLMDHCYLFTHFLLHGFDGTVTNPMIALVPVK